MPIYEYHCMECDRNTHLHLSYDEYDRTTPICPRCGSVQLKRRIGRVAVARSEGARLDSLMDDDSLAGLEDDPRAMGRFMRQMSHEMGEDLDDELREVAGRLEKGESLESIEQTMPSLSDMTGGSDDFD